MKQAIKILISCVYDADWPEIPTGFNIAETIKKFGNYKIKILLHGNCLKYALDDKQYNKTYNTNNPFKEFLLTLFEKKHVSIKVCEKCLKDDGFNNSDLLKFVKPVKYSMDYIIKQEKYKNYQILWDFM